VWFVGGSIDLIREIDGTLYAGDEFDSVLD
jgi:hypothetical protein